MENFWCINFELKDILTIVLIPSILFLAQRYLFCPKILILSGDIDDNYFRILVKNKTFFNYSIVDIKASLHIADKINDELDCTVKIPLVQETPITIYKNNEFVFKNESKEVTKIVQAFKDDKLLLFRITCKHSLFGNSIFKEKYFTITDFQV
jgi:hypothetical protein